MINNNSNNIIKTSSIRAQWSKHNDKKGNTKYISSIKNKFCCALFCQLKENAMEEEVILDDMDNISRNGYEWGICIFDVTTLKFYLCKIEEDAVKFIPHS